METVKTLFYFLQVSTKIDLSAMSDFVPEHSELPVSLRWS